MSDGKVKGKSFEFALCIIKMGKYLIEEKKEYILSKQIVRSGTAVGALIREAEHAESTADFIHKMAIAQKEANETEYWLELLFRSDYILEKEYKPLINQCGEIRKMLASIILTTKKKLK